MEKLKETFWIGVWLWGSVTLAAVGMLTLGKAQWVDEALWWLDKRAGVM